MLNIYVAEEKTSSHCVHRIVEILCGKMSCCHVISHSELSNNAFEVGPEYRR